MPREIIVNAFAEWTAFSATRSGAPIKSRSNVYPLIRMPNYQQLFVGPEITPEEFNEWHRANTEAITNRSVLPIGWAAKLINIYLKTRVYIGREGRVNLYKLIHPPIDNGLWDGVEHYCKENCLYEIKERITRVRRIKDIIHYGTYMEIIAGCAQLATKMNCELIEVEQLWQGTEF